MKASELKTASALGGLLKAFRLRLLDEIRAEVRAEIKGVESVATLAGKQLEREARAALGSLDALAFHLENEAPAVIREAPGDCENPIVSKLIGGK